MSNKIQHPKPIVPPLCEWLIIILCSNALLVLLSFGVTVFNHDGHKYNHDFYAQQPNETPSPRIENPLNHIPQNNSVPLIQSNGTQDSNQSSPLPSGFSIQPGTLSPDRMYGVIAPDWQHYNENSQSQNQLVNVRDGSVLATMKTETFVADPNGSTRNHVYVDSSWSSDGSVLAWVVSGRWVPFYYTLFKVGEGSVVWQSDILKTAEQEILDKTKAAVPSNYASATEWNHGGDRYNPNGFMINIEAPQKGFSLPLKLRVSLTSNPKKISNVPPNSWVESSMNATIQSDGTVSFSDFQVDRAEQVNPVVANSAIVETKESKPPASTPFTNTTQAGNFPSEQPVQVISPPQLPTQIQQPVISAPSQVPVSATGTWEGFAHNTMSNGRAATEEDRESRLKINEGIHQVIHLSNGKTARFYRSGNTLTWTLANGQVSNNMTVSDDGRSAIFWGHSVDPRGKISRKWQAIMHRVDNASLDKPPSKASRSKQQDQGSNNSDIGQRTRSLDNL